MSIKVNSGVLDDLGIFSKRISAEIGSSAKSVRDIKYALPSSVLSKGNLHSSFNSVCSRMDAVQTRVSNISAFLSFASTQYSQTENNLSKALSASVSNAVSTSASGGDSELVKALAKLIGKAGFLGSFLGFFVKPIAAWASSGFWSLSNVGAKAVIDYAKDGFSVLKGLKEWSESNSKLAKLARMDPHKAKIVKGKRLLGLNDMFSGTASEASSWSVRFYNNFHKLKGPFESYTSGGAKAALAWAGLALTVVSNGISNYEDYKSGKISGGRAVLETVTETAIDVGKNWLIGAAVAAGVAATVGSAPVLVVGALTVGITIGLDAASKYLTKKYLGEEKNLTEFTSDLLLDGGKAVIKGTKKVVSKLKTAVASITPSAKPGFSPLFG